MLGALDLGVASREKRSRLSCHIDCGLIGEMMISCQVRGTLWARVVRQRSEPAYTKRQAWLWPGFSFSMRANLWFSRCVCNTMVGLPSVLPGGFSGVAM